MSLLDGLVGGFIGAVVGNFSNFLAQRYFFNRFGRGLDKFENRMLKLFNGIKKEEQQ